MRRSMKFWVLPLFVLGSIGGGCSDEGSGGGGNDACDEDTCSGHGACNADDRCTCQTGYAGLACDSCAVDYSGYPDCEPTPCELDCGVHGSCEAQECVCDTGYAGAACDACAEGYAGYPDCYDPNTSGACEGNNCSNNGVCSNGVCSCYTGYAGSRCERCAQGYTGPFCVEDPCQPDPCNNHGVCTGGECSCSANFTGASCDSCIEGYGGPNCDECPAGTTGTPPDACVDDPCDPDPCNGNGTCTSEVEGAAGAGGAGGSPEAGGGASGSPEAGAAGTGGTSGAAEAVAVCSCNTGFAGPACDECPAGMIGTPPDACEDDPCDPDPCSGNGTCDAGVCTCSEGFGGEACDECPTGFTGTPPDECTDDACDPDPCNGHGSCALGGCTCDAGYGGAACDECPEVLVGTPPDCVECNTSDDCSPEAAPFCDTVAHVCVGDDIVAVYHFDEGSGSSIADSGVNGLDGTTDGSWVTGYSGGALEFDGTTGAEVAASALLTWGGGDDDFSVAYWIRIEAAPETLSTILHHGATDCGTSDRTSTYLLNTAGSILPYVSTEAVCGEGGSPVEIPLGEWVHFAEVKQGGTRTFYLNGESVGSTPTNGATLGNEGPLYIGVTPLTPARPGLDGAIDELVIYNRALGAAEVTALAGG